MTDEVTDLEPRTHTVMIFIGNHRETVERVHQKARQIFGMFGEPINPQLAALVTDITPSISSGFHSFFVAPDGGRKTWDSHHLGKELRRALRTWLTLEGQTLPGLEWLEVQFTSEFMQHAVLAHMFTTTNGVLLDPFVGKVA